MEERRHFKFKPASNLPRIVTLSCKGKVLAKASRSTVAVSYTHLKISVHNLSLKNVAVYAYRNKTGKANWEIVKTSSDTLAVEKDTIPQNKFDSEIDTVSDTHLWISKLNCSIMELLFKQLYN